MATFETLVAVLPVLAAVTVLSLSCVGRRPPSLRMSAWGLLLLGSFLGWGGLTSMLGATNRRLDLGMRAALGLAVHLAFGGVLAALSLISRVSVICCVTGGLLALVLVEWRQRRSVLRDWAQTYRIAVDSPLFALAVGCLLAAAMIRYLAFSVPASMDSYSREDDGVAYFGFARHMLASGTFIEPFSLRRIASLGGQTYLHASALAFGWCSQLHVVDGGLCYLLFCALVLGRMRARPKTGQLAVLLGLAAVVALPLVRLNTTSEVSGAVLLFALYRLLAERNAADRGPLVDSVPVALVAAAICTLRQNYMLPVVLFVALWYAARLAWPGTAKRSRVFREAATTALCALALLAPWMIVSYRSNSTFLFPLIKGTFRKDFPMLGAVDTRMEELRFFLKNVFYDAPVRAFGLFVLAAASTRERRPGRPLPALTAAVLIGGAVLVHSFQLSDTNNLARYFFALEVALVVAVIVDVVDRAQRGRRRASMFMSAAMTLAATGHYLIDVRASVATSYDQWLAALTGFSAPWNDLADDSDPNYRALQQSVPRGEAILVMLDAPYKLDFERNLIINVDLPGAVSPSPGMPVLQGGEALSTYLLSKSIRYFAYIRPTGSFGLYQRAYHERVAREGAKIYAKQTRFFLSMFDNAAELARTRRTVFDRGDYVVLDLHDRVTN